MSVNGPGTWNAESSPTSAPKLLENLYVLARSSSQQRLGERDSKAQPSLSPFLLQSESYQEDIYPPTAAAQPSLTAHEWLSGMNRGEGGWEWARKLGMSSCLFTEASAVFLVPACVHTHLPVATQPSSQPPVSTPRAYHDVP